MNINEMIVEYLKDGKWHLSYCIKTDISSVCNAKVCTDWKGKILFSKEFDNSEFLKFKSELSENCKFTQEDVEIALKKLVEIGVVKEHRVKLSMNYYYSL
ncbi:hypothetical protein KY334_00895 [Candidatus Woesearchaeota archaeon]|nr:hypothetical protein [Candidatus Woesearchaeota archaeon]